MPQPQLLPLGKPVEVQIPGLSRPLGGIITGVLEDDPRVMIDDQGKITLTARLRYRVLVHHEGREATVEVDADQVSPLLRGNRR